MTQIYFSGLIMSVALLFVDNIITETYALSPPADQLEQIYQGLLLRELALPIIIILVIALLIIILVKRRKKKTLS